MFKFLFNKFKFKNISKIVNDNEIKIDNKNEVKNSELCTSLEENISDRNESKLNIKKHVNLTDNSSSSSINLKELESNDIKEDSFEEIIYKIINSVFEDDIPEFIFVKNGRNILGKLINEDFNETCLDKYDLEGKIQNEIIIYLENKNHELIQFIKKSNIDNKKMAIKIANCMYKILKAINYNNFNMVYGELFNSCISYEELLGKYVMVSKKRSIKELVYLAEYMYSHKLTKKYFSYENIENIIKKYDDKNKYLKSNYYMDNLENDILKLEKNELVISNVKYFDNDTRRYELGAIAYKTHTITFYYNEYKITTSFIRNEKLYIEVYKCHDVILVKLSKQGNFVAIREKDVKLSGNIDFSFIGENFEENYNRFYTYLNSEGVIILNEYIVDLGDYKNKSMLSISSYADVNKLYKANKSIECINEEKVLELNSKALDNNQDSITSLETTRDNKVKSNSININNSPSYRCYSKYYGTIVSGHYRRTKNGKVVYVRTYKRR